MKKQLITITIAITVGFFFLNFTTTKATNPVTDEKSGFEIPADVQQIIDNSCFGCHNSDSKNEKGKKKLQFDKMADLKTHKLVGALADISDVVSEGDMPPEKALQKYPEMKLSDEDKATLVEWANKTAEELSSK